jgi:histidyl-tRNA synthetase
MSPENEQAVFGVIDKVHRQPREISQEKLVAAGITAEMASGILDLVSKPIERGHFASIETKDETLRAALADFGRYQQRLEELGVADWVDVDLSIVRGLAYYTGIVFELFDARGELRAICGGGRYDNLLKSIGNADMPALGFGMGDVVLGELLHDRGLNVTVESPDFWVASVDEAAESDVVRSATALRRSGASVEYALRKQQVGKQKKAAQSAGATYFVTLEEGFTQTGAIRVEELGNRDAADRPSPLMRQLADRPSTLASLLAVLRDNPGIS